VDSEELLPDDEENLEGQSPQSSESDNDDEGRITSVPPLDGSEGSDDSAGVVYNMRRIPDPEPDGVSSDGSSVPEAESESFPDSPSADQDSGPQEIPETGKYTIREGEEVPSLDSDGLPEVDLPPTDVSVDSKQATASPDQPRERIRSVPPLDKPSREKDAANLGRMSFYKRKNIDKGRGDNIPGLEKDKDGNYRQTGRLDSGQERDEEGLRQQRDLDLNQDAPQGAGPLEVDLQPDIIPDVGFDGASSFKPDGQDSTQALNDVQSAADAVDTLTTGLLNVLARLTLNMKKANDNIRQLMDKLEVEDHRDEF